MRSISTLPGAAARAPTKQARDARLHRGRSSSPRATTFQAHHSKSNPGTLELQHGHASATTRQGHFQIGGEADGVVNTDISDSTRDERSGAAGAVSFERDALTFPTRDSAFDSIASAHCERSRLPRANTRDVRLQPTFTNVRSSGASRRAPLFRLARPRCSHLRGVARWLPAFEQPA